ncbi:MAG: DNA repair protein RadA [Planctomycetes bacterium]|nr:DNA repair protein RadA [Planctomycetota bacterium]
MAKARTVYTCQQCGAQQPKWLGRCPDCGEWDTLVEETYAPPHKASGLPLSDAQPQVLATVRPPEQPRLQTGIGELDRVLGGGIVAGSAVLFGGDPGIGKSTLLLQACHGLSLQGLKTLYVTGEESLTQLRLRAERLGIQANGLLALAETNAEAIVAQLQATKPDFAVVDSIQMVYKPDIASAPGSVSQVRDCAGDLVRLAKAAEIPIALIGHVTKEGAIAGPRVLEHMVDTVLYFEGDRYQTYRLLRAVKNRFGPTDEIGVFEMRNTGLAEVTDLADVFVSRQRRTVPGSVVVPVVEGTRALLVEVQALVSRANFGTPERKVSGLDRNRVAMLLAVLEKRADLVLADHDVFVNVVGGVKVVEPAADLAAAIAVASSFTDRAVRPDLAALGEVGLAGEVRGVSQLDARLREAARLGWQVAIAPRDSARSLQGRYGGLDVRLVSTLAEALEAAAT